MSFPLGKPIVVMIAVALISGAVIVTHRTPPRADLVLWTFAQPHADTYRSIIDQFERQTGLTVNIEQLASRPENVRLESMFMSGQKSDILPDVVEMEISQIGKFFLPPANAVGFLPLNDRLHDSGWDKRIAPMRFAPWSKGDVIFGVPHDVHPVTITYRADLFDQAGIDLASARTWSEFQDKCLAFQSYWQARGYPTRHAMELKEASSDYLTIMLLQRGVNLVDGHNQIHIDEPIVAQTIAFYAQLVAGPRRIGWEAPSNSQLYINDLSDGNLCAIFTPDWKIFDIHEYGAELAGKLRMMPLPRFEPSDAPTSTWGGTMIGITRNSRRPDDAWRLIQFLYLSQTGHEARLKVTNILPPVIQWWDHPAYHQPDPFFGGQKVNELYVQLARQIPPRYVTPVTVIAQTELSIVVDRAVKHVQSYGSQGLDKVIEQWLKFAAGDLKARVENGRFGN